MTSSLELLVHLVHTKNNINRKRRRFYSIMSLHFDTTNENKPKHINKFQAAKGYEAARSEMKSMTKQIKQLMKDNNVFLRWDNNWRVKEIVVRGEKTISAKSFQRISDEYIAETHLLR